MGSTEIPHSATTAHGEIRRVDEVVQSGRRFRSQTFVLIGLISLAYFAVMGGVTYDNSGLLSMIMTLFPILAVIVLIEVWGKHRGLESRQLLNLEYRLAGVFAVLVCIAGVLATVLSHPLPAALSGILPAAACFFGAGRVSRR